MKFRYSGEAADLMASEILSILPLLPKDTLITNIPTVSSHLRQSGIDHTKRIAKRLSQLTDYRYIELLSRSDQKRQVGASRGDRLTQMQNVFRPKNEFLIKGSNILLIDDVVTTGATIQSATSELKKAGAKSVSVAVFARAK